MLNTNAAISSLSLAVLLGGLGTSMIGFMTPTQAAPPSSTLTKQTGRLTRPSGRRLFQPVGKKMPTDTVGGGSRSLDRCPQDSISNPVTLLTPNTLGERTAQDRPTLLAYIDQTSAKRMFFSIQDEEGKYHYQTMLPTPTKAGLVTIKMPTTSMPLEQGRRYRWSVVLSCGNRLRPDSPRAESWIERINLGTTTTETAQAQIDRLWSQSLWYDTVNALADRRRANPQDTQANQLWQDLLSSVNLGKVASAPFVN